MKPTKEIMTPSFALFNSHVNDALEKSKSLFIKSFGQDTFDKELSRFFEEGVMLMMSEKPNRHTAMFVGMVTAYANSEPSGIKLSDKCKKHLSEHAKYMTRICNENRNNLVSGCYQYTFSEDVKAEKLNKLNSDIKIHEEVVEVLS